MTAHPTDPVALTADLIRCPSVTPKEGGALLLLEKVLSRSGFHCIRVDRNNTPNLFARWGGKDAARTFGFNGHTDVVPPGSEGKWTNPPFSAIEKDGALWGRGATDMKSGVAAFAAAAVDFVTHTPPDDGSVIITVTGDEEGSARDGTTAILDWMNDHGERMDVCLVGEPTCPDHFGEMIKIGRRGSLTLYFRITGVQGHSAYPHLARNPLNAMVELMDRLAKTSLDDGTAHFDPSTLAIVAIDTGNIASNVIPAECTATVNIRFNDAHSGKSLINWASQNLELAVDGHNVAGDMTASLSGESFLTPPGAFSDLVSSGVQEETGMTPVLSTSGGTSDARFIKDHCPVVEFGLVGKTMHQINEHVPIADIVRLKAVYARILKKYFQ
ncbi:MAG: succinyl-diaminopimelate desuccinylase [Roseovarius sp.]|nr:succinyl-diaminopimelate desuccinylase [Roseovarius sp.]